MRIPFYLLCLLLLFLCPESLCNRKDWQEFEKKGNWSAPCFLDLDILTTTDTSSLATTFANFDTTKITTPSTTEMITTTEENSITTEAISTTASTTESTTEKTLSSSQKSTTLGETSSTEKYKKTKEYEPITSTADTITPSEKTETTNFIETSTSNKFITEAVLKTTEAKHETDTISDVYAGTMPSTKPISVEVTENVQTASTMDSEITTNTDKISYDESTFKIITNEVSNIPTTVTETKKPISTTTASTIKVATNTKPIHTSELTTDNTDKVVELDESTTTKTGKQNESTTDRMDRSTRLTTHSSTTSSNDLKTSTTTTTVKPTTSSISETTTDKSTTFVTEKTTKLKETSILHSTKITTGPSSTAIDDKNGLTSTRSPATISSEIPSQTTSSTIRKTSPTKPSKISSTVEEDLTTKITPKKSTKETPQVSPSSLQPVAESKSTSTPSRSTSKLPKQESTMTTTTSRKTKSQQPTTTQTTRKTNRVTDRKTTTTTTTKSENKHSSRQDRKPTQQTTETTPITLTLIDRKTSKPVEVNFLLTTPIHQEMMTDNPPDCPNGMIAGNLFCYGSTTRSTTFMEQMFGCKIQYGKKAQLVPEYALHDYYDRQIILNMTSEFETTKIIIDPEGGPLLRDNKLAVVRDLNEFPWRGLYSENPKELVGIQDTLNNVAGVCRLPKKNGFPDCSTGSLFTVFGLDKIIRMPKKNNTLYKSGSILSVHCQNPSTYVPVWKMKCLAGWWSPSPHEIECKIKRGTPYEPKPSGFYQPYVTDCSVCWDIGTDNCTKDEEKGKFKCNCKPGFEGFHCEGIPQYCGNDAQAAAFCNNHGRCYNNVTGAVCVCFYGWGGSNCHFDRRKFEWNRYGYYSGAQIFSTLEAIVLYIYVMYRIIDTKLNHEDTRLGTVKTARTWAELAYIIVFAMHRKPQLLGLSNATCDLFYTLTHGFALTVQLYYTFECVTYMGVKMCWHRNVWSNWDDRDLNTNRARNVAIYLGIPFYLGLLTPFFISLFIAGDYSLAEDWTCIGRLEHVHSKPVAAILVCGGIYMIIGSLVMWSTDNFEREANDTKLKRHSWFIHFAPLEVEFTQKVTRQSFALRWLPRLFYVQHLTGVLTATYPEWVAIDRVYVAISCIYSLIYTYQSLQSDSRRWKWLCTWLMIKLPKRFAPQFNPMTFMTRDETLAWKKPELFWKEIREEVVKELEEEVKERKNLIEKRNRLIQNYPDLPVNLLPHIPEPFDEKVPTLEEKIKARADEKLKYKPFEIKHFNEFFPMYLQEVIQLNIIKNYVGDRLKRKGSMSVLDTAVHFGLMEYDYWKNLYVHFEDGKRSRVALEQLTAIVGETILSVTKNDWNRYRREHSNNVKKDKELRQKNPGLYHYLKGRKFVKPWFPNEVAIDDKADEVYKKIMEQISYRQCQGMPHACEYGNMMQRFAKLERARPYLYITRFPYIRSLRTWKERLELQKVADEDANTNWEKVYENDTWFENLTDYQKEALRTEYKIHKPDKKGEYMNPRKLEQRELFDSFWEWRKPTFIGPREKKCYTYPELGHPLCSHAKRWCEEADEFEFTNYIETQQAPFEEARADGQSYVDYEEEYRRENMHIPNPGDHGISPPEWALKYIKKRTRSPNRFH